MIAIPGMTPTRHVVPHDDGFLVYVTAPAFMETDTVSVKLTADQYLRFTKWLAGEDLIQNLLPDLTISQREMLMTGLDDDDFKRVLGPDPDEEID